MSGTATRNRAYSPAPAHGQRPHSHAGDLARRGRNRRRPRRGAARSALADRPARGGSRRDVPSPAANTGGYSSPARSPGTLLRHARTLNRGQAADRPVDQVLTQLLEPVPGVRTALHRIRQNTAARRPRDRQPATKRSNERMSWKRTTGERDSGPGGRPGLGPVSVPVSTVADAVGQCRLTQEPEQEPPATAGVIQSAKRA